MKISEILNVIRKKLEETEKSLLLAKQKVDLNCAPDSKRLICIDVLNRFLEVSRSKKELSIILTHKCNLSCAYCLRDANSDFLSEIPFAKLKKIIASAHRFGIRAAGITGGEPFLYSHWKELIELLGNLKWRILWETNGGLVNEDALDFIKKHLGNNAKFLVSLDSRKEQVHDKLRGEGAFKKAIAAIELIKSRNFFVQANAVLTPSSALEERELIDYVNFNKNIGVDCVSFNRAVNLGRGCNQELFRISDGQMDELRFLFEKHNYFNGYIKKGIFYPIENDGGCERLGSEICVSPFGIHPCVFQEGIKLGELEDFDKLFFDQLFLKSLNIIRLASISDYKGGYFGCAGCMESFSGYLKKIQKLGLMGDIKKEESLDRRVLQENIILPASFSVLLTQKCNFNCDFCEFECSPDKTAQMDINDFEKLLHEGRKIGVSNIVLDGGEPLVYGHIEKAMRLCRRYGYNVTILTNGWQFNDYLPKFKKYNVKRFIFGINGATAKTNDDIAGKEGSFEKLAAAIKKAKQLKFFAGLHLVIHPLNVKELDHFFRLAKQWGVDYIMTSRIIEVGRAKNNPALKVSSEQIEEVRKIYRKHQDFLSGIQFYGAYLSNERSLQCKYLARDGHLSVHWGGEIALCSMTPLLGLPFRKIRDYPLLECLAAANKANIKFGAVRDEEFPLWHPENPHLYCEYCHQRLSGEKEKYFMNS